MAYEPESHERHGASAALVLGILAGAAIGAGLALLLAPRSGRETRRELAERARKARESAAEGYRHGRERVEHVVEKGREAYEKARGVAQRARDDVKQSASDLVGAGRES